MKKIRAVLFDMDGLMFDTQRLWDKAWKQAGEACGVPMGEEQIAPLRGRSLADSRAAFEKNVAPGDVFDRCNTMADALVREWLRGDVPMKHGLLPLLAYLQKTGRAMAVVSSIGVVLLGSLPVTEFLQRRLKRPCTALGARMGLDSISVLGLLVSIVSPIPALVMMKDMNTFGKLVNVAYMVSSASMLAAHLGFTVSTEPDMLPALLVSKLAGCAAAIALGFITSKTKKRL